MKSARQKCYKRGKPGKHGAARLRYACLEAELEDEASWIRSGELESSRETHSPVRGRSLRVTRGSASRLTIGEKNRCGHAAFPMEDRTALAVMALTSFYNEAKFYGDNTKELIDLARKLSSEGMGEYVAQVAVWARTKGNMRAVSHALIAIVAHECPGKRFVRPAARAIASVRGDDGTEMLAAYAALYGCGSRFPHALLRGIRDALEQTGAYAIAKYQSKSREWSMRDTLRLTHPVPRDAEASEAMRACIARTLKVPKGWESELSERGNTADVWNELLAERRVGFMAQLRNMRNIILSGADVGPVLQTLCDSDAVRASRQLPFRFYSAWRELRMLGLATTSVTRALETAMKAACANAERLGGRTAIMIDSSGSMGMPLSSMSRVTCRDVAAVLAAMVTCISDDAWVCHFDSDARMLAFTGESILADVSLVPAVGGWTNMRSAFDLLMASGFDADRIIVLSDNEVNYEWGDCADVIQRSLEEYRLKVLHDVWCHAIDLQGYGTQQFIGRHANIMGGWNEQILRFIAKAEDDFGGLVEEIEAIRL